MTDEPQDPHVPGKPAKRTREPKRPEAPGAPRRKSGKKREEAHHRMLKLVAARMNPDTAQGSVIVDALVRTWIDPETLIYEPDLQDLMWVQYRYMSPLERTELFTKEYIAAYRRAYARYCGDEDAAARKQPCEAEFFRNDMGDMNCLWYARAIADALGVPYDMYLDTVMAGKLVNGKWVEPPLPNQLYAKVDPARLRDRPTPEEISKRLFGPDWDARFFADRYRGDPVQEAAIKLIHADVWAASSPAARLGEYLVTRRAITEDRARTMFGQDLVDMAIAVVGKPADSAPQDVAPYRPSCFGYPQWLDTSPCRVCRHVMECWQHDQQVRAELVATSGSDNPRLARKRAQAAERRRRWYDKHVRAPRK